MRVLGIETSCDETAAAVVAIDPSGEAQILSHAVASQIGEHRPFGGIVPEVAARAHLAHLDGLIRRAMGEAKLDFTALDGVAATAGPGLIGGVLVGVTTAKSIAVVHRKPFIAVNHLEGHALTARLTDNVAFPYLLLLVSGGHCQLLAVEGVGRYRRLGTTVDDAAGEAFDKVAKMLGLGYPGGPAIENAAKRGDAKRFDLPRPMKGKPGCDFSFSGLKTAVRAAAETLPPGPLSETDVNDIAAGFQAAVVDSVIDRVGRAFDRFADTYPRGRTLVVAGGVAANTALRAALESLSVKRGFAFVAPPVALCTDNAVMIAWAGVERLRLGLTDPLDFKARPRWPLDPDAPRATGAGVKA
ncbi:MAG: tRNA (adenosine(37)-N6)-threonylcarbamoyltransferase complex transferase subunit TsaD [Rhodobacteraceae bacterium]|nr:tRNA (adenosine(37)-N6)-threonylcarbamoyltransferase complex transferase subunit TsaD [Planctomycetales bacterium]MCB2109013.1 tRNA (adenosine(37)-N6)-threonylcarbamoyltransferase complex transferase subunit TsaD [Paracoccaceae bacterium]